MTHSADGPDGLDSEAAYVFGLPEPLFVAFLLGSVVSAPLTVVYGFEAISVGPFEMIWSWGMVPMLLILLVPTAKLVRGDYDAG